MEGLLDVVNKIQKVCATLGTSSIDFNLPQIVVVGPQSSGKSSVLENIAGREFLPRGDNMVTRCPLVLQLKNVPLDDTKQRMVKGKQMKKDWAEFLHSPNQIFTAFNKVREEIEAETDRRTNYTKNISHEEIVLTLYSDKVVNLTLVDLPGITKMPVDGQPHDIEEQIVSLIRKYIENKSSIILAMAPANVDLANAEALKIAAEVDPSGERTLCVLTKLDLVGEGSDVTASLTGQIIPVKLGLIGVINRSQADINNNTPIIDVRRKEREFLHRNYGSIADVNGVEYLGKTLEKLLKQHIKNCAPELRTKLQDGIRLIREQLPKAQLHVDDKRCLLVTILQEVVKIYEGETQGHLMRLTAKNLTVAARIRSLFQFQFIDELSRHTTDSIPEDQLLTAIRCALGPSEALFIPEQEMNKFLRREITELIKPCKKLADDAYIEMRKIVDCEEIQELTEPYEKLTTQLRRVIVDIVDESLAATQAHLEVMIRNNAAFIDFTHPEMCEALSDRGDLRLTNEEEALFKQHSYDQSNHIGNNGNSNEMRKWKPTPKEKANVMIFRRYMSKYFEIMKKMITDQAPKAIVNLLMNRTYECLRTQLISKLFVESEIDELLAEDPEKAHRRKEMEDNLKNLEDALGTLNRLENDS